MRAFIVSLLLIVTLASNALGVTTAPQEKAGSQQVAAATPAPPTPSPEFENLRAEGNEAVYNMDYQAARERFQRMTQLAPDHPAGYVYLANNLWLETLNASRRLSTTLYSGGSFYKQDAEEDEVDRKREQQFNALITQAINAAKARLQKNPQDAEALYYQASAYGLRAGYSVTVKRSFRKSIGDANNSVKLQKRVVKLDPSYVDSYLSIGLYEYVMGSLPFVWRTLARLVGIKGDKKKGMQYLETVAARGKYTADDARVLLIGLYGREGKPERALEMISYLAEKYPRNYLFGVERGVMLYNQGRAEEGARTFAALLKDERIAQAATDVIYFQWGESLTARKDYAAAVERYNEVKRWPKSEKTLVSLAHLHAGQALDILGKRDLALAEYKEVLKRENVFDSHKQAKEYTQKPYVAAAKS